MPDSAPPPPTLVFAPEVDLFWEDMTPGREFQLGSHLVTEEEILAFGRKFDPQPFHVDPGLARRTVFGGLIASGWHSGAIWMRLYFDAVLSHAASLGSAGLDKLQWRRPVRPGDRLQGLAQVISARPSESHPERGWVDLLGQLRDEPGELKVELVARVLFARRPPG